MSGRREVALCDRTAAGRGVPSRRPSRRRPPRLCGDAAGLRILLTPAAAFARIERVARAAGATSVAVARADRDAVTETRLRAAFARGDLTTWSYDDAYARRAASPGSLLAGARSVVCIAVAYATPPPARSSRLGGRVSNYAWGANDYHRVLRASLETIASEIDAIAGERASVVACDTAPLAERALAERAGLGWVGKHTNVIVPGSGSFVFLGEVVTTLVLPPTPRSRKSCGTCARCVDACPTGALRGDYTIDASRCISDLTQRRDAIPVELRPLVGDWIWGCDLCQDACPPTVRAGARGSTAFAPADAVEGAPSLVELLGLRGRAFERRFRHTAMGWRGAAVLRRNAAVALGNARDRSTVSALVAALRDDPSPLVRAHVAWALGRIASPAAIDALRSAFLGRDERSRPVRAEIARALSAAGGSGETFRRPRALDSRRNNAG